jgi:hypothetical protein
MRFVRVLAVTGAVAVLMGACSSKSPQEKASDIVHSLFPSGVPTGLPSDVPTGLPSGIPTAIPSGLLPSGLPSGIPTAIPTGLPGGPLTQGTAHLEFTGSSTATLDLPFKNGSYAPGAAIGLAYQDSKGDSFAIGGVAFTGTAKTSAVLTLGAAVLQPVIVVTSSSGECTLTLSDATATHVKGTADCTNLNGGVNLKASFEATG